MNDLEQKRLEVRQRLIEENEFPHIPEDWGVERLRFLVTESKERNGKSPVGDMLSVSEYRGVVPREYEHEEQRRTDEELENYRVVRPGQLAVNSMWLNHLGLGVSEHTGHVSPAYNVYDISDRLDRRFVHHLMRSNYYLKIYLRYLYGIRPNSFQIKSNDWASIPIIVPDLATQRQIADFLDRETARIDLLIEKKQRLVALQNERRQSTLERLVLGGARASRTTGKDWIVDLPADWQAQPLKHLVTVFGGATPSKDREDYWQGDIPWVSPKDMKKDVLDSASDYISDEALMNSPLVLVPAQSILIVVRGMILARRIPICRLNMPATINQDMKALIAKKSKINPEYLQVMLQGFQNILMSFVEAAAHGTKKLRAEELFSLKFPVPPLLQQLDIVERLGRVSHQVGRSNALIEQSIDRLKEYRSALITAAVTGQIDVSTCAKSGTPDRRLDAIQEEMACTNEIVVPFESKSIQSLLSDMNTADLLEPKPGRKASGFIEFLVARFKGIKIEIFSNEHPPPHFRVKTNAGTGNFRIDNCEPLHGDQVVLRRHREIRKWHSENRQALIDKWNHTRPSDCTVGKFREVATE